jgi:hypothetical protein
VSNKPTEKDHIPTASGVKAEARAAEAAAIRRRWINLGELLAAIALIISALTLWNSWSERSDSAAEKRADARQESSRAERLVLTASPVGAHKLLLKPASATQSLQSQTIAFAPTLGLEPVQTTGEPRIEASWFEGALKNARGKAGLPDNSRGDERLPILITTRYLVDGQAREDLALYDVGYTITGHWLSGHSLTLRGLSRVSSAKGGGAEAMLTARWNKLFPGR